MEVRKQTVIIRLPETMGNTREVAETSFCPPMQKGALEAIDSRTSGGVGGKAAILLV